VAASSVRLPLEYLIGIGVLPLLGVAVAPSPVDCLLEKYRRYLLLERRLAGDHDRRLRGRGSRLPEASRASLWRA
jgi:hypothetical protein